MDRLMLQRAGVAETAASDDGSQGWRWQCSLQLLTGGLGFSHTRASLPFLHCSWAGTPAVLSWSWVRRGLQVSGLLHCGFPSAERGAALSTATILPCLLHDWVWPCLSLFHGPSIMQTVDQNLGL